MLKAATEADFQAAFAQMVEAGAGAVVFAGGPFFGSQRRTLAALALRHHLASIFDVRESVADGALMSYSASITDAYRQVGAYVGKILKGAKPTDLPVQQSTKFEFVINLQTARALGIDVPPSLLAIADEVIE
jgi:putative ABC transport system substrate-binding protein